VPVIPSISRRFPGQVNQPLLPQIFSTTRSQGHDTGRTDVVDQGLRPQRSPVLLVGWKARKPGQPRLDQRMVCNGRCINRPGRSPM